jgi:hypothetical protein
MAFGFWGPRFQHPGTISSAAGHPIKPAYREPENLDGNTRPARPVSPGRVVKTRPQRGGTFWDSELRRFLRCSAAPAVSLRATAKDTGDARFAIETRDDTELGLAILVAEFGDGNSLETAFSVFWQ